MKRIYLLLLFGILVFPNIVYARQGCCSHHGGVAGCSSGGRQVCADGSLSKTCTCTPPVKYGCTDVNAKNYDSEANKDNGKCEYYKYGCMDKTAKNYDPAAEKDSKKCEYYKLGCTDKTAKNYDASAEKDDGSCIKSVKGCVDSKALNYNSKANVDDGSCKYKKESSKNDSDENGTSGLIGGHFFAKVIAAAYILISSKNKK